jgi:catecholate siderophore receptor
VFGGYALLLSEITESNNPREEGNELSNTPKNTFSLWMTYDLPWNLQIGGGAQYTDSRFNTNTEVNRREAPSYLLFDAMAAWNVNKNFSLRLNVYNLTDEEYIDRVGGGHFVPGAGRSAVLTASFKF